MKIYDKINELTVSARKRILSRLLKVIVSIIIILYIFYAFILDLDDRGRNNESIVEVINQLSEEVRIENIRNNSFNTEFDRVLDLQRELLLDSIEEEVPADPSPEETEIQSNQVQNIGN